MEDFREYKLITDIDLLNAIEGVNFVKKKGKFYCNCPCSFDTEVSSFTDGNDDVALVYVWMLDINGLCFYGREIDDFVECINRIVELYKLSDDKFLVIYVQNLGYEFQFIRKLFSWISIFARTERKPMVARITGVEFRCSYVLSGYSLSVIARNLVKYEIEKLKGDLDYKLLRTPKTPLTEKELGYCLNDILIVEYFIREEIERNGDITKIPMTQTGYVRRFVKENCYPKDKTYKYSKYSKFIKELTLEAAEYKQLKRAFAGGFTHCSCQWARKVICNVASYDFCSSYPAVMCSEKFPMSKGELIQIRSVEELKDNCNRYCCVFDIKLYGVMSKLLYEHPISASKCYVLKNAVEDNGRVVSADELAITITEVDLEYIIKFYSWDRMQVADFRRYQRGYLPKPFIMSILSLYKDKTELKGIEEYAAEYMHSKQMVNSAYGMSVTDICPDEIDYTWEEGWTKHKGNLEEQINGYNHQKQRFLYYPWGVYVTAYARRNLFTGIAEFGDDYIYSDTDSIKCLHPERHQKYIDAYNKQIVNKLKKMCDTYDISYDYIAPKDKHGNQHVLGIWDYEGTYDRFKSLGAKRYLVEEKGKYKMTVSGVAKDIGVKYLQSISEDPFRVFDFGLVIPEGHTGKNIHQYIDDERKGEINDYLGIHYDYHVLAGIHLSEAAYEFSLAAKYIEFLNTISEEGVM